MNRLFIFGAGQIGEVSRYYFASVSPRRRIYFVVDDIYYRDETVDETPVIPLSEAVEEASPQEDRWFTALSYQGRNTIRQKKSAFLSSLGFQFDSFVHPSTQAWDGFRVPVNSMILENNVIQYRSTLGPNSIVWSNNHIGHHSQIGHTVFISSEVVISGNCQIGNQCFLGVNASVIDGICVGDSAVLGAGATVRESVPARTVVR